MRAAGGKWINKKPTGWVSLPYRLPELIAAPPDVEVHICEGPGKAERLAAFGLIATANPYGAGHWTAALNPWFVGKQAVVVYEDNNEAGRNHVAVVTELLQGIVPKLSVVAFRELDADDDVVDWLDKGHTREELLARPRMAPPPARTYTLVRASDIVPQPMDWVWSGHILRGALELLTGQPGVGKSHTHSQYVACITTGRAWPDKTNGMAPANAIMLTAEDMLDKIIVPRLLAAGADLERVHILKSIRKDNKQRMFLLGEDIEKLAQVIANTGDVQLVTIDPITAYMGGKLDSHRATDVRHQLGPLAELAERTNVAFSAITHPAKNAGQRALDAFIGSQAFIAAARIGHMCVEEMDVDENGNKRPTGRALFTNPKNNPHTKMPTIAYRIVPAQVGDDILTSRVAWEEIVEMTADEALAASMQTKEKSGVAMFLLDILANGPVPKSTIEERAEVRGFSVDRLQRAKAKVGIVAFKEHGKPHGAWFWALPQHAPKVDTAA